MKIAHVSLVTPRKCGLYETARELAYGLRQLGHDARFVDPVPKKTMLAVGEIDRGVPISDMEWGCEADVLINHSGYDKTPLEKTNQPIIHVAHGRPLSSFLSERNGSTPIYSYAIQRSGYARFKAVVTFWPEYEPYLEKLWAPKKVFTVSSPVDLNYWSPGKSDYNFAGLGGKVNVVMADPWSRVDVSPLPCLHAFLLFADKVEGAKLHLFALDGNMKGITALTHRMNGTLGVRQGWAADLRSVYRSADLLITPHKIYTRSIREALACDLPVVSGRECDPEDIRAFALHMYAAIRPRSYPKYRNLACNRFDISRTAREFDAVLREAL